MITQQIVLHLVPAIILLIPLDETIALAAADIVLQESLAMADAIIVAVSRFHNCTIISSDADLKDQANVKYIPKI